MEAGGGGAIVDGRPRDHLCSLVLLDVLQEFFKGRVTVGNNIVTEELHASWE